MDKSQVKAIIERAISEGRPVDQIQARIKAEGYTYDELSSTSDTIAGYLMKGAQGLTMGHADEIGGAIATPFNDKSYEQNRDQFRTAETLFNNANPVGAPIAEIGGGIATGAVGMMGKANTLKNLIKEGVALGSVAGHGYSKEETLGGKAKDIAIGAGMGGTFGAVTRPVMNGLKATSNGIVNLMTKGGSNNPATTLTRDLNRDGLSLDDVMTRLDDLGGNSVIADVGGNNTKALADHVAQSPSQGAELAETFLNNRASSTGDRISNFTANLFGKGKGYYDEMDILLAKRAETATPIYNKYVNNTDNQVELNKLAELVKSEPYLLNSFESIGKDSLLNLKGVPPNSIKYIDTVKKSLDAKEQAFKRSGNKQKQAMIGQLRHKLTALADDALPEYSQARKAFSIPSQQVDQMKNGRNFLKGDYEIVAADVEKLSPENKEAFLSGVVREIDNVISSAADNTDIAKRLFGSKKKRDSLKAAFGDDDKFNEFAKVIDAESKMHKTRVNMTGGSPSYKRIAKADDVNGLRNAAASFMNQNNGMALQQAMKSKGNPHSNDELASLSRMMFTPKQQLMNGPLYNQLQNRQSLNGVGTFANRGLSGGAVGAENTQAQGLLNFIKPKGLGLLDMVMGK